MLLLLDRVDIGGREREESDFGGGHEARDDEQKARYREGDPSRYGDHLIDYLTE
jgi:hypothetical protein